VIKTNTRALEEEQLETMRQDPKCPSCDGVSVFFVRSRDFNRQTTDLFFTYHHCKTCGLVFMDPIPQDMRPFYKGGYQKIPATLTALRGTAKSERYRMDPVLRYKSGGKLLEIGPWTGIFSCNAKDAGFDVTAMDIDESCVEFLNTTLGIRALHSSDPAETLASMEEKFDVIAIWHCLEHLPRPWDVVARAAEKLAPGGMLLIAIPNIESHEFEIFKGAWRHLDAPRHLYFYPADSLVELCREHGLEKLEVTTKDMLSRALSHDTWYSWVSSKISLKYVTRSLSLLAYQVSRLKERDRENSGSGITALFQRPISR
jgi:2-polyprenyl-3-methyl-5-hydroxy-6-metoxy-1,4-benzoquinol methylase